MDKNYKPSERQSFRPLSGSYISQSLQRTSGQWNLLFPSPIGELHFSMIFQKCKRGKWLFPSPIGELHFSIQYFFNNWKYRYGFRPLSGSYISQYRQDDRTSWWLVSVPYRGATFLNMLFSNFFGSQPFFRPLSGSYISQYTIPATPCPVWDE